MKTIILSVLFLISILTANAVPIVIHGGFQRLTPIDNGVIVECDWRFWKKCAKFDAGSLIISAKIYSPDDDNQVIMQGTISSYQVLEQNSQGAVIQLNNFVEQ